MVWPGIVLGAYLPPCTCSSKWAHAYIGQYKVFLSPPEATCKGSRASIQYHNILNNNKRALEHVTRVFLKKWIQIHDASGDSGQSLALWV